MWKCLAVRVCAELEMPPKILAWLLRAPPEGWVGMEVVMEVVI